MDLLKSMLANRQSGPVMDPQPRRAGGKKKETKTDRAKENVPGSKQMRVFIIEEKPSKKIVREHFDALIEDACNEDSD
jgi:hypothetical protein